MVLFKVMEIPIGTTWGYMDENSLRKQINNKIFNVRDTQHLHLLKHIKHTDWMYTYLFNSHIIDPVLSRVECICINNLTTENMDGKQFA